MVWTLEIRQPVAIQAERYSSVKNIDIGSKVHGYDIAIRQLGAYDSRQAIRARYRTHPSSCIDI